MEKVRLYPKKIDQLRKRIKTDLPKSWLQAAGILRKKKKSLESHLKKIRTEWN